MNGPFRVFAIELALLEFIGRAPCLAARRLLPSGHGADSLVVDINWPKCSASESKTMGAAILTP
jgi:hypothetical protein